MEEKHYLIHQGEFSEQFISVLQKHWPEILLFVHRESPPVSGMLRFATPVSLKRIRGVWYIQVTRPAAPQKGVLRARDHEIVSHSIRLWAHSVAHLKLPRVVVEIE